jgi:hypothetical protein
VKQPQGAYSAAGSLSIDGFYDGHVFSATPAHRTFRGELGLARTFDLAPALTRQ